MITPLLTAPFFKFPIFLIESLKKIVVRVENLPLLSMKFCSTAFYKKHSLNIKSTQKNNEFILLFSERFFNGFLKSLPLIKHFDFCLDSVKQNPWKKTTNKEGTFIILVT